MILMPSKLITRDNVGDYKGWSRRADPDGAARGLPGGAASGFSSAPKEHDMARGGLRRRSADRLRADRRPAPPRRRAGLREGAGRGRRQRRGGPGPAGGRAAPLWAWSATTRSAIFWPTRCARPGSTPARCGSPARPAPPWPSSRCAPTASASSCSTATPAPTCCSRPAEVDTGAIAGGQGAALRFDQPRQPEPARLEPVRRRSGAGGRPSGHLRRQPAPAALARRHQRQGRDPRGLAKAQVVKLSDDELEFLTGSRATRPCASSGTTACSS